MPDRPRARLSRADRRDQVVEAAIRVVAERGFNQTSMAAVAVEAGVAKGLIWHHFDDAEDVLRTTARRTAERLRDEVASGLDLGLPVTDVVRQALASAAGLARSRAVELRAVRAIADGLRDADGRSLVGDDAYDETYALQRQLFSRGLAQGVIRELDLDVLVRTYQAAIDAMIDHLLDHPDVDPSAYATTLADLLLTGIAR